MCDVASVYSIKSTQGTNTLNEIGKKNDLYTPSCTGQRRILSRPAWVPIPAHSTNYSVSFCFTFLPYNTILDMFIASEDVKQVVKETENESL